VAICAVERVAGLMCVIFVHVVLLVVDVVLLV